MRYLGVKPFLVYSDENLPIGATGLNRHGIFYEYETIPTTRLRYIYIEQPNPNIIDPGWYHQFEVNIELKSSEPDDLEKAVIDFASMIISYTDSFLRGL